MSTYVTRTEFNNLAETVAAIAAHLGVESPAKVVKADAPNVPATQPVKVTQPKADVRYRTQAQKDRASAACEANWTKAKADAGVKRVSQLTPAQKKAVEVANRAVWAATKGTRKTPVA